MDWVNSVNLLTQGQVIAVDGKTLRRSHDRSSGKAAIHMVSAWVMVSAWASENSLVLGQIRVDAKSRLKSRPYRSCSTCWTCPVASSPLHRHRCIVAIDAMGCQKKIARQIVNREANYVLPITFCQLRSANYVLAVKENQGRLLREGCWRM